MGEPRHVAIEEWKTPLNRMRHEHPIALGGEEIARQQRADFEILVLRQSAPLPKSRREIRQQVRDTVMASQVLLARPH